MSIAESFHPQLFARLVDSLYVEAMVMADEARSYFDRKGAEDRDSMELMARLGFSCESLKVTTRLMHVIAWLLTQRAWQKGEISTDALSDPKYRLGAAARTDTAVLMTLPPCARELVTNSQALYDRVLRLQEQMLHHEPLSEVSDEGEATLPEAPVAGPGPARDLLRRLEQAF